MLEYFPLLWLLLCLHVYRRYFKSNHVQCKRCGVWGPGLQQHRMHHCHPHTAAVVSASGGSYTAMYARYTGG